jgi:hypothetical protein
MEHKMSHSKFAKVIFNTAGIGNHPEFEDYKEKDAVWSPELILDFK